MPQEFVTSLLVVTQPQPADVERGSANDEYQSLDESSGWIRQHIPGDRAKKEIKDR